MGEAGAVVGPDQFRCAMCGGIFDLGDDDEARAEAEAAGIDPEDSGLVCDDCYGKTPWGGDRPEGRQGAGSDLD